MFVGRSFRSWCLCLLVVGAAGAPAAFAFPHVLGVLEERPSGDQGLKLQSDLRVGFVKTSTGWEALHCPVLANDKTKTEWKAVCGELANIHPQWRIYHRGKLLGVANSTAWIHSDYSHESTLHVDSAPTFGTRTKAFSGWLDASVHRPLVAVSAQLPDFPGRWREDQSHPEQISQIWPAFRSMIPSADVCSPGSGAASQHVLLKSDIKALPGWQSNTTELLLNYQVNPALQKDCDMADVRDLWFHRDATGKYRILPGQQWSEDDVVNFTPSLELVDVGNFGGDSDEQALFFFSGYNLDGYILYCDHFSQFAKIKFSYH